MRDHVFVSNRELMMHLKESGYIKSEFIFDIMCSVDRKNFTTDDNTAYVDKPQLVAYGKPIAAPHMHAVVLELISENLRQGSRALDICSGSGYLTICMALALGEKGNVIGIDSVPGFKNMANKIAESHYSELLKDSRLDFIVWDGRRGWPWNGPYDVIHIGAAAADVPQILVEQLAPGGILIMPVGSKEDQILVSIKKSLTGTVQKTDLMKVKYIYLDDVDLPWSNTVRNNSITDHDVKYMDALSTKQPKNSTTNRVILKENVEKSGVDTQQGISENQDDDLFEKSISNSLESMTTNYVTTSKSLCDISRNTENGAQEPKKVLAKIGKIENKMECDKLKSYESVCRLHCSLPIITGNDKAAKSMTERMDFYEKNMNNFEITKSQENITLKSDLVSIDGNESQSNIDTEKGAQSSHEKYDSNRIKRLDQTNQNTINVNQSSKLIKDDSNELFLKSRNSVPTIIASEKNKAQTVREKIGIYENLDKYKLSRSQETIATKISMVPKEENAVIENPERTVEISCITGERTNALLETAVEQHLVNREMPNASQSSTKLSKNIMQTNEFVSTLQLNLKKNKQTRQRGSLGLAEEKTEVCQNSIQKKPEVDEKDPNENMEENDRKIEKPEQNQNTLSSEFNVFKNEIKVMLDNFLSVVKENHEEVKLHGVNLNINRVNQIQLVNNHDSEQECNCKNAGQTEKSREKLGAKASNNMSVREEQSHIQLKNISELIEKLQTQYKQLTDKNISDNEELQKCVAENQSLEKRLNHLERKFKIAAKILTIEEQPNTHDPVSELSFMPELNLMKTLLNLGKESSFVENKLPLINESESTGTDENEMSSLKLILEE